LLALAIAFNHFQ